MAEQNGEYLVELDNDLFVISGPYHPEVVEMIRCLPGREYDSAIKAWLIPPWPESAAAILDLADSMSLRAYPTGTEHLRRLAAIVPNQRPINQPDLHRYVFRAPSGDTLIHLESNPSLHQQIKELTGAYWDRRSLALRIPTAANLAREILYVGEVFDFVIEPEELERLLSLTEFQEMYDGAERSSSRLHVDVIVAYNLMKRMHPFQRDAVIRAVVNAPAEEPDEFS